MLTTTQNYGLHQWEAGDHFLRTDFNEDFAKIDAGISAAKNAADRTMNALIPVSYNVYSLILQNYYEKKETGFKKALLFDGFLDTELIDHVTGGGYDRENHCLILDASLEAGSLDYNGELLSITGTGTPCYQRFFCTQSGMLHHVTLKGGCGGYSNSSCVLQLKVIEWHVPSDIPSVRVLATSQPLTLNPTPNAADTPLRFSISCPLTVGTYGLQLDVISISGRLSLCAGKAPYAPVARTIGTARLDKSLAYLIESTYAVCPSATLYTRPLNTGVAFSRVQGYVHGQVTEFALIDKTGTHPMTLESTRVVGPPGPLRCQEHYFTLDLGAVELHDPVSVRLSYDKGSVIDYGIILT